MKKSTKILLGGFLTIILLITGIHVALYARYKSGKYTIYKPIRVDPQISFQKFPNVSTVIIRNTNAYISFGDTMAVEKETEKKIEYILQGDSLVITPRNQDVRLRNTQSINLVLPDNVVISAYNSELYFEGSKDSVIINTTMSVYDSRSRFEFSENSVQLKQLKVNASGGSSVNINGNTSVDQLELQLTNSVFDDNAVNIGSLSIITDSTSQLGLQSRHLLKAKITSNIKNP